jgi:hypothetical protein
MDVKQNFNLPGVNSASHGRKQNLITMQLSVEVIDVKDGTY